MTGSPAEPTTDRTARIRDWLDAARVRPEAAPTWMAPLVDGLATVERGSLSANDRPADHIGERQAAVLVLLSRSAERGPEVLLERRARGLRHHAGEISFPGGRRDDTDPDPVATALREAAEETGLDPVDVDPVALFPRLILRTGFHVTGVLAHGRSTQPLRAVDAGETSAVLRVSLSELADPAHRLFVRTEQGWSGPAFRIGDAADVIWGYTAEMLVAVLRLGGWERPWSATTAVDPFRDPHRGAS